MAVLLEADNEHLFIRVLLLLGGKGLREEEKSPSSPLPCPHSTSNFMMTKVTSQGLPWRAHVVTAKLISNLMCVYACGLLISQCQVVTVIPSPSGVF